MILRCKGHDLRNESLNTRIIFRISTVIIILIISLFNLAEVQSEEIKCTVDPAMNLVRMQIMMQADCSNLNASGKQILERLNYQFESQQMSQGIIQQAKLVFTNRLQLMLGSNISVDSFNMTYRYTVENQTFKLNANMTINGPISYNGSNYIVRAHWRWINASGDCEFEHQQNRHRFNFAKLMGLDLSRFNTPLEQWTRERDQNQNMTIYSLTVTSYNTSTVYGKILIDPTQLIETPGETFAAGDLIQLGSTPIPEFEILYFMPMLLLTLLISLTMLKKLQSKK